MLQRIGLAFQGGSFLAGAIDAGVVSGLVEARAFEKYDISAYSGTSAGALVAAVCWRHALQHAHGTMQERMATAPEALRKQWLHNANGMIFNQAVGDGVKAVDHLWSSTNPAYFWWKDKVAVEWLHGRFQDWLNAYVEPETCMDLLYQRYVASTQPPGDLAAAQLAFDRDTKDGTRPRLLVGATRVKDSEDVNITDEDFFAELVKALKGHPGDHATAIRVAADYMRHGIMASGSIDFINGMTTIKEGRHAGTYLDGAWSENPPLKGLLSARLDQIWMVEVFPRRCAEIPDTFAEREDRREELWQNAVVEQQRTFINKVNLWIESGRLISDATLLAGLKTSLLAKLKDRTSPECQRLLAAFRNSEDDWEDKINEDEKIVDAILKPYRYVETRCIQLPPEMQSLTAGARLVNTPSFLLDKMEFGRANTLQFLTTLH
ncbi:MAG: hypothetical protein JNJ81_14220 [Candidatus Accumulibacter sp.]|nr:hypothetical protein [Accumulibacter sp.]